MKRAVRGLQGLEVVLSKLAVNFRPHFSSPISLEEGDCKAVLEPVPSMDQDFSIMHIKKNLMN